MGDGGEGLIDADARIQERMEDLQRIRERRNGGSVRNPEQVRALESLKLARTDLNRQFELTAHDGRRRQISQAIEELDRRIAQTAPLVEK
ncbi:MAG: hypothetical protein KGN76_15890 [Acidobacteriota bacterium]|nr:hypothetical protein [Acidobacteriota bacterium]